jgi:hypothetical protein
MQIAAQLVLARIGALPGVATLRPGAVVVARVLERNLLSLAGQRVAATLPDDVLPGEVLRLRVREAAPERLVLQLVPDPSPVATAALALPGGATARLIEQPEDDGEGGPGRRAGRAVLLRYDSPTLGRLDIRLAATGAVVQATAGPPADAARASAGELAAAIGAPVTVVARRSALDAQA